MITQIIIMSVLLLVVPTIVGALFRSDEKGVEKLVFQWVSGQIVLWAVFLVISVPLILLKDTFSHVRLLYNLLVVLLAVVAVVFGIFLKKRCVASEEELSETKRTNAQRILWTVFAVLLFIQLVLSVCLAYEEGDDAFYVAISTATASSERMYQTLPYTGMTTALDFRHGLAPFPVWIAYLAKMSGMVTVTVAQVVMPPVIILMTYAIYYLLGRRLFAENKKRIPFFMILLELMILFGGYSAYSAENFLLVRATQGKAVIANVILPFLFYLLFCLADSLQKNRRFGVGKWILLASTMMAGCLCSTLGTLLTGVMLGSIGVCLAIGYGRWKILFPLAMCCIVPGGLALLYFVLR